MSIKSLDTQQLKVCIELWRQKLVAMRHKPTKITKLQAMLEEAVDEVLARSPNFNF